MIKQITYKLFNVYLSVIVVKSSLGQSPRSNIYFTEIYPIPLRGFTVKSDRQNYFRMYEIYVCNCMKLYIM